MVSLGSGVSVSEEKARGRDSHSMVQYGMPYRTDGEQMGEEKYFLPDEFLHYHFYDCEDKSIFFKMVVERLLHLEVKILDFDRHVAQIVNLNDLIGHDPININGKNYYYCETTGKGYQLGQTQTHAH